MPMMQVPTEAAAANVVEGVRRDFGRILASWALDLLELRRQGLLEMQWSKAANPVELRLAA